MSEKKYDGTVARIAGNLMSGWVQMLSKETSAEEVHRGVARAVSIARAIVAETKRTEES